MSNFCNTELCASVESKATEITSADTATDLLLATFLTDKLATDRTQKINYGNLPDANTFPNGHLVYLDDAKVPVIASNGTWIGLDGRTVGTFVENQIWTWGRNNCGRLGDGTTTDRCSPVREISSASDWCQVSAGNFHTAAVKTSGQLWGWGNGCGRLGDGTITCKCTPVREICSATDWCQVSAGRDHTAAVKTTGQIWAWGENSYGRLGDGTQTDRCSPVREICSDTNWCQVSAGHRQSAAIKTSGELWTWGGNFQNALGDGSGINRCSPVREISSSTDWCCVSAQDTHAVGIKTSGQIWGWGNNGCGRLGDGTQTQRCSPVREISSSTDWCVLGAGFGHTTAIKTSGELWTWGENGCGQLGDGTTTAKCSPVREICSATDWNLLSCMGHAPDGSASIKTDGTLWVWGLNNTGQLGDGTTTIRCSPVREYSSDTNWCQVSFGDNHTAAIKVATVICR